MATLREVVVKEEELCCYICLEVYDRPRTLPCLHSFCHTCLVRYVEKCLDGINVTFSIPCPICRVDTPFSKCKTNSAEKLVQNLPINFTLVSILGSKKENMSLAEGKCVQCLKDKLDAQATVYCYECSEQLCDKCKEIHKKVTMLSSHRFCDIKNRVGSVAKLELLKSLTRCPEHISEEVRYVCRDHDQLCCNECAIVAHRKCDRMVSINKEFEKTDNSVRSSNERLKEIDKVLDQLTEYEIQHQSMIKVSRNEMKDKLKNMKTRIDNAFESMERSMCAEFDEKSDLILKESRFQTEEIKSLKAELKLSVDKMQAAKDVGQQLHLFVMQRVLSNEIARQGDDIRRVYCKVSRDIIKASENAICNNIEANIAGLFCITKKRSGATVPLCPIFLKHKSYMDAVKSNLGNEITETPDNDVEQETENNLEDTEGVTYDTSEQDNGNKYVYSEVKNDEDDYDNGFDFDQDIGYKVENLNLCTSTKTYSRHRKRGGKWKNRFN